MHSEYSEYSDIPLNHIFHMERRLQLYHIFRSRISSKNDNHSRKIIQIKPILQLHGRRPQEGPS
jgi:hypothetical protein